jgi:hypothetical protein
MRHAKIIKLRRPMAAEHFLYSRRPPSNQKSIRRIPDRGKQPNLDFFQNRRKILSCFQGNLFPGSSLLCKNGDKHEKQEKINKKEKVRCLILKKRSKYRKNGKRRQLYPETEKTSLSVGTTKWATRRARNSLSGRSSMPDAAAM